MPWFSAKKTFLRNANARRVPALGHVSRAGSFRNEFEHSGGRHFLDAGRLVSVDPAARGHRDGCSRVRICVRSGSWSSVWRAALMLATYLGRASDVSRTQHDERNWRGGAGSYDRRSQHALFGASFQLTFLAVFIIAGIGSPILERTTLPYAGVTAVCKTARYDLHVAPAVRAVSARSAVDCGAA